MWLIDFQRARLTSSEDKYEEDWSQLHDALCEMASELGSPLKGAELRAWVKSIKAKEGL